MGNINDNLIQYYKNKNIEKIEKYEYKTLDIEKFTLNIKKIINFTVTTYFVNNIVKSIQELITLTKDIDVIFSEYLSILDKSRLINRNNSNLYYRLDMY